MQVRIRCFSASPLTYLENHSSELTKFSVHVVYSRGSFLLLRYCSMLRISSFVHDAWQRRRK